MRNLNGLQKWIDEGSGFEPHLSASKIALYKNDVPSFICRYGLGLRQEPTPAMVRGTVCERALVKVLTESHTLDEAIKEAWSEFNGRVRDYKESDEHMKQLEAIDGIINQGYEALKDYGKPYFEEGQQEKIEFDLECGKYDWTAPMIGYLDLVYPDQGLGIDLKTTLRCPSVMSWSHALQWAIYKTAKSNYEVKFLYTTPKKSAFLEYDGTATAVIDEAKELINKMNFFCFTLSPSQAKQCIPTGDNFYWNNNKLKEIYGA